MAEKTKNSNLSKAKTAKNDEFYTQYNDIQIEINAYLDFNPDVFKNKTILLPCDDPEWSNFTRFFAQNFEKFGLKKLISTSYAAESKQEKIDYQPSLFEVNDPKFDESKTRKNGKIFTLTRDKSGDGKIDVNDLDWVSTVFIDVESEMRGLEWGRLYEKYKKQPYNSKAVSEELKKLYADPYIKNRKGIFEYILGGSTDSKLLEVRVFDEATKKSMCATQSALAEKNGVSNCPLCALGHDSNKTKIWHLTEMDADHVTAWSKGGATDSKNCQMLCKTHNRAKGNK